VRGARLGDDRRGAEGDKFGRSLAKISGSPIGRSSMRRGNGEETGIGCDEIDAVIVSHLHFDLPGDDAASARGGEKEDGRDRRSRRSGVRSRFTRATNLRAERRVGVRSRREQSVMTRIVPQR